VKHENLSLQPNTPDQHGRLEQLSEYFTDIADGESLQPDTMLYVQSGGSLRLCLQEIVQLAEKSESEKQLDQKRTDYVDSLLEGPVRRALPSHKRISLGLRDDYVDAVVGKTEEIVDAHTPEEALSLMQMPTLIKNTSFGTANNLSMEDFSANHLYVLIDTALQEHAARRSLIDEHHSHTRLVRFFGHRVVRMALAGGVFAATLTPELHVIPVDSQAVTGDIDIALRVISASIFGLEVPEEARWRYLDFIHGRRSKTLHEHLAESKRLSDLALRATYSSTRYGSSSVTGIVTDRFGTDDKDDNMRRFRKLDDEFRHLNNDPGGKPYTGDQALGYAARLLIERKGRLADILAAHDNADEQKKRYLQLVRDIVVEDVMRMEKGLSSSRIRQPLVRLAGIIPAVLFPSALAVTHDASSGGKDVVEVVSIKKDNDSEE